jgi:hypothetical protein
MLPVRPATCASVSGDTEDVVLPHREDLLRHRDANRNVDVRCRCCGARFFLPVSLLWTQDSSSCSTRTGHVSCLSEQRWTNSQDGAHLH